MKKIATIICVLLLSAFFQLKAQKIVSMHEYETLFISNFTELVGWPESVKSGNFIIGVLGNSPVHKGLVSQTANRYVGNQKIKVKKFKTVSDISQCHILFISVEKSTKINLAIKKLNSTPTLIIGEKTDLLKKGAAINFIFNNNRLKFELKKENASKYGLKISSRLERLATYQ